MTTVTLVTLMGCGGTGSPEPGPGVSRELARYRARTLSDIRYDLRLEIPDSLSGRIRGGATIRFRLIEEGDPLILDFARPPEDVLSVSAGGAPVAYDVVDQHIVIPAGELQEGENALEIEFRAGDESLNRTPEFLYTLFVPDRARFAFPCFDQPDLKARYRLALRVPETWRAVSNTPLDDRPSPGSPSGPESEGEDDWLVYQETPPISTYLFSFAAGRFEVDSAEKAGRVLRMYHRETDNLRVARNREAIFDLHASALEWLESYTGIPYPFPKFDFVLIPSFQYGGMEHPGAVLYRASRLLLEEGATQNERLGRASLIAHETSHMWFGDLVTMEWFNDVWMKEVFANFMAAKIVNPSFPDLNHELRFLLTHYPPAYAVDRTAGANPIRQELENLREAGTLYGDIIYQKAPIVMRHLEDLVGEEALRSGLRTYLKNFSFRNASWNDLIAILDADSPEDLAAWSRVWVEEPGRPTIRAEVDYGTPPSTGAGELGGAPTEERVPRIASLRVTQSDPARRDRLWVQRLGVVLRYPHTTREVDVLLQAESAAIAELAGLPRPDFILPEGAGRGYGLFRLDETSRDYLLAATPSLPDPMTRGIAWLTLWDAMLEGEARPVELLDLAMASLEAETVELLVERILGYLEPLYWRYLGPQERSSRGPELESLLWNLTRGAPSPGLKTAYFSAYRSLAETDSSLTRLQDIWRGDLEVEGLALSERDFTRLAQELALRQVPGWDDILTAQQERIGNPDRRERFAFVRPALSADASVRDAFFARLAWRENREREPWVLEGLSYLHHPLRAPQALTYIRPSLEMLEEIQATGDIFFPRGWLDATLDGHSSQRAAEIVRAFLEERSDYPPRLRAKILQSADGLFRAAAIQTTR